MNISQVQSRSDLETFIELPYKLYQHDPMWVPPLRRELRAQFNQTGNPMLEHCEYALFLLRENGKVTGRIAAFYDIIANKYWNEPVGLFGYYECPRDGESSRLLMDTARDWLKEKGMRSMRGPWSFVSQEWGSVVEGYEPPAVVMAPYNPPYYNDHFLDYGLQKAKDLLVYYVDAREGYDIPERIINLTDKVTERYGIRVRSLDMQQYDEEVDTIIDLSNRTLNNNWGYTPVTDAEARALARDLKPIIQSKAVLIAEDAHDVPVGFGIAIPDVNLILKKIGGRLFPFGWYKLLTQLPRLKQYRMFGLGVIPEFQGKGVDSLIYRALYDACYTPETRVEINYVLEDNDAMNNAILKLGAKPLRRYRVYEKKLQ